MLRIGILGLLLLFSSTLFAQTKNHIVATNRADSSLAGGYTRLAEDLEINQHKKVDAEKYYLKAIQTDSLYTLAYRYLGSMYTWDHRYAEAEKCFLLGISKDPSDKRLYTAIGFMYQMLDRNNNRAAKYYIKALTIDSTIIEAYYPVAQYYLDKKDTTNAELYFKKGIEVNPTYETDNINKGILCMHLAFLYVDAYRYAEAEKYYILGITFSNVKGYNLALLYSYLGDLYIILDEYKNAEDCYNNSLSADSNKELQGLWGLGRISLIEGKYDEAIKQLGKYNKEGQLINRFVYLSLAFSYALNGDMKNGLTYLTKFENVKYPCLYKMLNNADIVHLKQIPEFAKLMDKYYTPYELNK